MKISNNKILITGGGSGIGLGLTERFLNENNTVIICGRRTDVLEQVQQKYPNVIIHTCDLADESERVQLIEWIKENHSDLNVLVNNAGIQNRMDISDKDFYSKAQSEIEINAIAPIHLCSLFMHLPALHTIINVTSGLAFVQLTKVPVYCATKAFLHSFTISLRHLAKSKGIEVIEIIPPALNTDLGGKGLHDNYPPVSDFINGIFKQLEEGKDELTFGFSEFMVKANPDEIKLSFQRMNAD